MGVVTSMFRKPPAFADADFVNPVTTDMHSHLIPAIDDGVQTVEESLMVLRELSHLGYKKVVTTPHIMGDFYKNSRETIMPGLQVVRDAIKADGIPIELDAAAEYLLDDALEQKIKNKELLTFGKNYVLVELPFSELPVNLNSAMFELRVNGYKPVLAHPERYPYMAVQKEKLNEMHDAGILFQVNLYSLTGHYSPEIQKTAEWLIDQKMVDMIGSDTHGPRHLPLFHAAIRTRYYQKACALNLLNNTL
jgi:tyrosine-protein phosphatase YwqE